MTRVNQIPWPSRLPTDTDFTDTIDEIIAEGRQMWLVVSNVATRNRLIKQLARTIPYQERFINPPYIGPSFAYLMSGIVVVRTGINIGELSLMHLPRITTFSFDDENDYGERRQRTFEARVGESVDPNAISAFTFGKQVLSIVETTPDKTR